MDTTEEGRDAPAGRRQTEETLTRIWDRLQRLQADFCINQELPAYYTSAEWARARRVADLGTGNGYYLRRIADRFPAKEYHGFDLSPDLIDIARNEHAGDGVEFHQCDLFDVSGSYDFVIIRLVLQHLSRIEETLDAAAKLTGSGGAALIIDACDPIRFFRPDNAVYMEFFEAFRRASHQQGLDRDIAAKIPEIVGRHADWRLGPSMRVVIPSTIPGVFDLFRETYATVIDLAETNENFDFEFDRVRQAWKQWCADPDAYTQVGLEVIQLDRL